MKLVWCFAVVLLAGLGFSLKKPANVFSQYASHEIATVKKKLGKLQGNATISQLKNNFLDARCAYKRVAPLTEYFAPQFTRRLNGPALKYVAEGDASLTVEPHGFAVVEEMLYNRKDTTGLHFEVLGMMRIMDSMNLFFQLDHGPQPIFVLDALAQAAIKLTSTGTTDIETPLAQNTLPELQATLTGIDSLLQLMHRTGFVAAYNPTQKLIIDAGIFLQQPATHFNNFDRLQFISRFAHPLFTHIRSLQQTVGFAYPRSPLHKKSKTLFGPTAFDASFFAPDKDYEPTPERIALGKKLFYSPLFSQNGQTSCATCHQPEKFFADGRKTAMGINSIVTNRNTPTLLYSVFQTRQFWDSRTDVLENQLDEVVHNKIEMGGSLKQMSAQLQQDSGYSKLFAAAYPGLPRPVSPYHIANAVSSYVRTLHNFSSRFDALMQGNAQALTREQKSGFNLFMGKAKCGTCHFMPLFNGLVPPQFNDTESEVLGVPASAKKGAALDDDSGKYYLTGAAIHKHSFKTPTLRNVARTSPYMHNGVYNTLEEVIDFYNKGGGTALGIAPASQTLPPEPLQLTRKEKKAIIAFLNSLSDNVPVN